VHKNKINKENDKIRKQVIKRIYDTARNIYIGKTNEKSKINNNKVIVSNISDTVREKMRKQFGF
jgi:hypothetical protein